MDKLKQQIKTIFDKQLTNLDLSKQHLTTELLELKLNSIVSNIISKVELNTNISIPILKTTNDNINLNTLDIKSGKPSNISVQIDCNSSYKPQESLNQSTTIPSNFEMTYEMEQYAKSKYIQDPSDIFEDFKLYYQGKGTLNSNWNAVWQKWVKSQNKYKTHLIKTVIKEDMILTTKMIKFASKYIDQDQIEVEFLKFKNHYIANGDLKVSWIKMWENWAIKHKQFKSKQTLANQEKSNYRWDFYKAKEQSDKIKDWLDFEMKIDWLNDYYYKNIPIFNGKIQWQKVKHADFNKDEILLYKVESENGNFMIKHKTDDIIDAEVLEND